jgi:hypothetical protein
MDPSTLAAFGESAGAPTKYARTLLGEITTRPYLGHDGRFFFAQANDPWLIHPEINAAVLDRPLYRSQRMAYPMMASLFGLLGPGAVVWALILFNLVLFGVGTWATAALASRLGGSPWLGLAFALNFGVISELDIDGAGVLALAAAMTAVLALERSAFWTAAILMAVSALAREVMLLFLVGVVYGVYRWSGLWRWRLLAVPIGAVAAWALYVRVRLAGISGTGIVQGVFALPFVGMLEASRSWLSQPLTGSLAIAILIVLVLFVLRVLRRPISFALGAAPFAALAVVLSANVWREPYDLARAIAPVLTAYPLLLLLPAGDRTRSAAVHMFD